MSFKTLRDLDLSNKVVLLRADLNVPTKQDEDGARSVTDTTRIDRLKPTMEALKAQGAKTVILSHFGRPKEEKIEKYSLVFLPAILEKQWNLPIAFAEDCTGSAAEDAVQALQPGGFLLLENLRFHKREEANDSAFVQALAKLGDIYVNDAFSAAHRAHASTEGLAHVLPCAAGLLMEAELNALSDALEDPQRPVAAIVGGAKISTKLAVLDNIVRKSDYLVLGGGMANTFIYADGGEVGASLCEKDMADEARKIMKTAEENGCKIVLPADQVIVEEFAAGAPHEACPAGQTPENKQSLDIGPQAIEEISKILETCKTVLWNGPMGVFELEPFNRGTDALAQKVAGLTKNGQLVSVAGGGDTVAALEKSGSAESFSYVSTAGGAFLEWLEGKVLPGVAALQNCKKAA